MVWGKAGEIDMARHLVLFVGGYNGTDGVRGLWETNGTAAGTSELTGLSGSPIEAYGLATFGNEVLFNGEDTSGNYGLWVTNGTAAGTSELTGITGADPGYLYPNDFTVFKGEVLFQGRDNGSDGIQGLWVTNGTAAGTHELTGITGADPGSYGLIPLDLTVFGNEVLFNGTDASEYQGLWVTNGTAAGTSELGVSGASPGGFNPSDLTVFGNRVLFAGTDATGYSGYAGTGNVDLWVTNGTGAGTSELTGISGAYANGLDPDGFTVFNGEVLFNGLDASGKRELWVTNGAAAGTFELTGISGANTSGISPSGLNPYDLTVFGNEVVFGGADTNDEDSLWVTNGTAAGTHELTGISGAYTGGFGLEPQDLTVLNGEVLFQGADTAYYDGLWVTNGTAAGTYELTGISGASTTEFSPRYPDLLTLPTTVDDFYASGTSDVLFRNDAVGDTGFYAISNGVNTGWHDLGPSSTAYSIVGTGDFYNTGTEDILFRSASTGDTGFYQMSNGVNAGWHDIGPSSTAYSVVGVGDFTGNGTDDILYRDNSSGDTGFYEIVNGVNTGWVGIGASSTAYSVVGTGDFTGSGTDDILYRDSSSGDTGFYEIVNGVKTGWFDVGATSTAYSVVGTGDFLGNGSDDILFRNNTTGDTGFYAVNNGIVSWHDIGPSSTAYTVVATGDYLGPGTSDIMFRNNTSGDTGFYAISNGVNIGWHDIGVSSTAYHVVS